MINFFSKMTVVKILLMFFPAVFFSTAVIAQDSALINLEFGLNELVYDVARTVVTVEASEPVYPHNFSQNSTEAVYSLISTGLIYDTNGYVIAPAESVSKYGSIFIRFDDRTVPAKTVAIDYQNGVALLKMEKPYGWPIRLKSQVGCAGQMILAVGNVEGVRASPALGICAGYRPDGMMQFSASFSASSRGGGLFSMEGKLLGIITGQIGTKGEIGLAIPAYKLPEIVDYLKMVGTRYAGYIGLQTREISISPPLIIHKTLTPSQISMAVDKDALEISHGLIIKRVAPHSPAYNAGLRKGDLVFQANGLSIDNPLEFASFIRKTNPGKKINFDFLRHNTIYNVDVTIGKQTPLIAASQVPRGDKSELLIDSILKEMQVMRENLNAWDKRLKELR